MLKSKSLPILAGAAALGLSLGIANPASAAITFVTATDATKIQQTMNNPCIIGDNSCNQPSNFESFTNNAAGSQNSYDLFSPVYVAHDGFPVVGNVGSPDQIPTSFTVAIDQNFAVGQGNQHLLAFNTYLCSSTATGTGGTTLPTGCGPTALASNSFTTDTNLTNVANGNGFSDFFLNGFSLVDGSRYVFEAIVNPQSDGMEEFFLVPSPIIGHGLLVLLAVGGVLFGSKLLERRAPHAA